MSEIVKVLMDRDGYSAKEAREFLEELRQAVRDGEDPEELLYEELGLEPDYLFELIDLFEFI